MRRRAAGECNAPTVEATHGPADTTAPPPTLSVERDRIAQELNRYIVHRLFGVGLKLQALAIGGLDSAVSGRLDECVQELDLAIADLRARIFNLTTEGPEISARSTERDWRRRIPAGAGRAAY
ncbi:MAG TPA: histidine kinase [Candidatus Acidoferrum sp.]|nr:histidine kinase [Candidatus Acidoferrum sp.]